MAMLGAASVAWEMAMDTVVAETVTDTQGRYRLCGLPKDLISGVYAQKSNGAPVYVEVAAGGDAVINFDLPLAAVPCRRRLPSARSIPELAPLPSGAWRAEVANQRQNSMTTCAPLPPRERRWHAGE